MEKAKEEAKKIAIHNSIGCGSRLSTDGYCYHCRLFPGAFKVGFMNYCPHCDTSLGATLECGNCQRSFRMPSFR